MPRVATPREKRPENYVGVRMDLPVDVRDRLMIAAAGRGQSMAACVRQVVTEWVDATAPPPKARKGRGKAE